MKIPADKTTTSLKSSILSYSKKKCLVIIPAYNEEENLRRVIGKIFQLGMNLDILVIDDGSVDRTTYVATQAGAMVISHTFNIGYAGAIQTGYKFAKEHGYDFIAQLDGDGQHDPSYLGKMFSILNSGEADVVLGSRRKDSNSYRVPFARKAGHLIFGWIVSILIRQKITDPTTGYQAFTRDVAEFMTRDSFPLEYPDADLIIMLNYAGYRIKEISVRMNANANKKSMHFGFFKPFRYILEMSLSIMLILLRGKTYQKNGLA